jgi:hypothetical protein
VPWPIMQGYIREHPGYYGIPIVKALDPEGRWHVFPQPPPPSDAVLVERERCARIVELCGIQDDHIVVAKAREIAAEIRRGE